MAMPQFFIACGVGILLLMFFTLYRAIQGPTPLDRLLGVNVIGTKTMVLIVITGTLYRRVDMFVDIALTYALLNFIASLAAARFFQRHKTITLQQEEKGVPQ